MSFSAHKLCDILKKFHLKTTEMMKKQIRALRKVSENLLAGITRFMYLYIIQTSEIIVMRIYMKCTVSIYAN